MWLLPSACTKCQSVLAFSFVILGELAESLESLGQDAGTPSPGVDGSPLSLHSRWSDDPNHQLRRLCALLAWISMAVLLLALQNGSRGWKALLLLPWVRVRAAYTQRPLRGSVLRCLANVAIFGGALTAAGFAFGLMKLSNLWPFPGLGVLKAFAGGLVTGIGEETIFRAMLLPKPLHDLPTVCCSYDCGTSSSDEDNALNENLDKEPVTGRIGIFLSALWSLAIFVIYHLDVLHAKYIFALPGFLIMAALLGCSCTLAFLDSGSVWLSIFVHATYLAVWLGHSFST
eukprot:TRINITY_DN65350_c0_g1_i1.p1 TRINITY_DN65350_c0_g1~~TRINITY_DN65350_c0_g1_i1.p1  ORF type:complete len:287 (+),score=40.56 TRINITY_DN65350_c0_g1_i1:80-940(+)